MVEIVLPQVGERYRHFKGEEKIYEILAIALDCEDSFRKIVIYKSLYGSEEFPIGTVWGRELDDFMGEKILADGNKIKRFVLIE